MFSTAANSILLKAQGKEILDRLGVSLSDSEKGQILDAAPGGHYDNATTVAEIIQKSPGRQYFSLLLLEYRVDNWG